MKHMIVFALLLFASLAVASSDVSKVKTGDYSFIIKDKTGTVILEREITNRINAENVLMDCGKADGLYSCEYNIRITSAKNNLELDLKNFTGKVLGSGAWLEDAYYYQKENVTKTRKTYNAIEKVLANGTRVIEQKETGTETYTVIEDVKKKIPKSLGTGETITITLLFKKDRPEKVVDIYDEMFGLPFKEASYWNGSYIEDHNLTLSFGGSYTDTAGVKITMKANMTLTKVNVATGCGASMIYLKDDSLNLLANSSVLTEEAWFDYNLTDGTTYYILADAGGGAAYNIMQTIGGGWTPISDDKIDWVKGWLTGSDYTNIYNIQNLTMQNTSTAPSPPAAGNVTMVAPTPTDGAYLNISNLDVNATNLTGFDICNLSVNETNYSMTVSPDGTYCQINQTLADGNYTIFVKAYNSTSWLNSNSSRRTIVIDTAAPSNVVVTNANNSFFYINNSFVVTFDEHNVKYCNITINGTMYPMTDLGNETCNYSFSDAVGNFSLNVSITDQANHTVNSLNYYFRGFNYSIGVMNFGQPQNDFIFENMTFNISVVNYDKQIHTSLIYGLVNYSATWVNQTQDMIFNVSFYPSTVSSVTDIAFNWFVYFDSAFYSFNVSNNTTISPTGLVLCGGSSNNTSLNISTFDEISNLPLSTTMTILTEYLGFTKTSSFSNASANNWTLCILPDTLNLNVRNTVTLTSTGYLPRTIIETYNISSIVTNKTYYLLNTTSGYPTTLKVLTSPNIPVAGVIISVYLFQSPSNYTLLESCTTDAGGACVVNLIPNTKQYVYNFTANGVPYSFGAEVLTCSGTTCFRTFTVGSAASIPFWFTGSLSGSCNYVNATHILTCSGTDTSSTIQSYTLLLSYLGNSSYICNTTAYGSSATINCNVPIQNETFVFGFYGSTNTATSDYLLSSGTISDLLSAPATYGRDGWLAMLLLFGIIAMVAYMNIGLGVVFGSGSLFIGMLLGLISFSQIGIVLLFFVTSIALAYRMKV